MPHVILSGGPGAGKTSLLRHLASLGFTTVDESARAVIEERLAARLPPRPDPLTFAEQIVRRDAAQYRRHPVSDAWVFFDRGLVEAWGLLHESRPMPQPALRAALAAHPFHPVVFMLPPWADIYVRDDARDHSFEHAVRVHASLLRWYAACGYAVDEVPRQPVAERAQHVLRVLGAGA